MEIKTEKVKRIFVTILLYYSIVFSVVIAIGGFYVAKSVWEYISTILFLPVIVSLFMVIRWKRNNKDQI